MPNSLRISKELGKSKEGSLRSSFRHHTRMSYCIAPLAGIIGYLGIQNCHNRLKSLKIMILNRCLTRICLPALEN